MNATGILRIGAAGVVTAGALLSTGLILPAASADPCPAVQVVYARGTNEPPGLGFVEKAERLKRP